METESKAFTSQLNFNFISDNANGLQSSKNRAELFEYFRNKITPKGILFLQETHSSKEEEKNGVMS